MERLSSLTEEISRIGSHAVTSDPEIKFMMHFYSLALTAKIQSLVRALTVIKMIKL